MKKAAIFLLVLLCALPVMGKGLEGTFKTTDGQTFVGRTVNYKAEGTLFKLSEGPNAGGFTERIPWKRFTQETLMFFNTDPEAAPFVQLLVVVPDAEMDTEMASPNDREESAPITVSVFKNHERPDKRPGFIGSFFTGGGFLLLLLLYAGNVYAGYEISFFRRYPMPMVTGVAAVAPFIGPIVFLCMPTKRKQKVVIEEPEPDDEYVEGYAEGEYAEGGYAEGSYAYDEHGNPIAADPAAGGYAGYHAPEPEPEPVQLPETKVFERGKFNLNRRFIESKFAGFFRAVPGENEKDMIMVVRASQGEFISNRVLKATNTEVTFSVPKGEEGSGATVDKVIPLNDLLCITLKHKDAPD